MLCVHSLAYSRAHRVIWLLEELGTSYELKTYDRTEAYRAPPELKALHPLGKAPVVIDGDLVLTESAAILRYLHARYGDGRFAPDPSDPVAAARHDEWLDYAEGSFARAIVPAFWHAKRGDPVSEAQTEEIWRHLGHIAGGLDGRAYLTGERLQLADIQLSYLLAMAEFGGVLKDERLRAYFQRLLDTPALQRSIEKAGPIMPPR